MKNIEFSSKNGVFDMNSFICACDAAVSGEPLPEPQEEQAPAPAELDMPAPAVPVADGPDPITYHPLEEVYYIRCCNCYTC